MSLPDNVSQHPVGTSIIDPELSQYGNRDFSGIFNDTEVGDADHPGYILFSDAPETVPQQWIGSLLFDSGAIPANSGFRVFVDHVNGPTTGNAYVQVWISNLDSAPATVTGWANGSGISGGFQIKQYLSDLIPTPVGPTTITIPVNTRMVVATSPSLPPGGGGGSRSNCNLIWDFRTQNNVEVFVTITTTAQTIWHPLPTAPTLGYARGTFTSWDVTKGFNSFAALSTSATKYHAVTPGRKAGNTVVYFYGKDYATNPANPPTTSVSGVYGVRYKMVIPVSNSTNQPLCYGIVLNPRGGQTFQAIVGDIGLNTIVPSAGAITLSDPSQRLIVSKSVNPLGPGQVETKRFFYLLPAGSNPPAQFVVVPFSVSGSGCGA